MFQTGQKLKANLAVVEAEYSKWKGSQAYANMIANAQKYTFEVVSQTDSGYLLRRSDGKEMPAIKTEAHSYFVPDDNGGDNKP